MNITINNWQKVFGAKQSTVETMELQGYELIEELFTDSSGFGHDDEPALSVNQFESRVQELLQEHGKLTAKITNVGMFQVYVGLFKRTGDKKTTKVANNTYLVNYGDGKRAIRLHDTDIITENGDGTITINNGGWATRTTHARINEFSSVHAQGKNFETVINGTPLSEQQTFDGWIRGA